MSQHHSAQLEKTHSEKKTFSRQQKFSDQDVYLVADVGGTNARLSLYHPKTKTLDNLSVMSAREYGCFQTVIKVYLDSYADNKVVLAACFAVASPIVDDQVQFTNNPWSFSIKNIKKHFGFAQLYVINDFAAVAHSLLALGNNDILPIHQPENSHAAKKEGLLPRAVLGPGTGLGIAACCPQMDGSAYVLASEGGHSAFAPTDELEIALLRDLKEQEGHRFISREDLLSGAGILRIARSLARIEACEKVDWSDPSQITNAAFEKGDEFSLRVMDLFCAILGATAGDVALQLGALGGVYLAGGIVPRFSKYLLESRFLEKYKDKGRYQAYVENIPLFLITHEQPGLLGAACFCHNSQRMANLQDEKGVLWN